MPEREIINETAGIVDRPQSYSFWYEYRYLRHGRRSKECIGFQRAKRTADAPCYKN